MHQAVLHLSIEEAKSLEEVSRKCSSHAKFLVICGLLATYKFPVPTKMPVIHLEKEMLTINW